MSEKIKAIKDFLFENILEVASVYGSDKAKEEIGTFALNQALEVGGGMALDLVSNSIPAIGPAIANFKTNKRITNTEKLLSELNDRHEELSQLFQRQTENNKKILDNIFGMIFEKTANMWQEEKIKYIVTGYSQLLKLENPSFDVAYLYFDTLDKLTILDISVLKLSYGANTLEDIDGYSNYEELLKAFDINYDQYVAIRENLNRLGLMENEYDNKLVKDIKNLQIAIDDIRSSTESVIKVLSGARNAKIKSLSNKSKVRLQAKDKLKISKFGRDFIRFFIENNSSN